MNAVGTYDQPFRVTYAFGLRDLGTGANETTGLKGPKGMRGRVSHIGIAVTEVFAGSTGDAAIQVGTPADPDKFANLVIPAATPDNAYFSEVDDPDAILHTDDNLLDADTLHRVTFVSATGTPTGQGFVFIVVDWF